MYWLENLWIMYLTQSTLEDSVNMSTMANGGNSLMTHSVRICTTMRMIKTTGNPTTTILIVLWYYNVVNCFLCASRQFELRHFDGTFNLLQAQATSEGSHEYFEDIVSLLNARKTMSSFNLGVTFGINKMELGLSGSHESEFIKNITKNKSQVQYTDPKCFTWLHVFFNIYHFWTIRLIPIFLSNKYKLPPATDYLTVA